MNAQSGDSIRIKLPLLFKSSSDSLNLKSSNVIPDVSNPQTKKESLSVNNDKISMEYNIPNEKKTFFNSSYSQFIIPTALISYGIITIGDRSLLNLDHSTNNEVGEHLSEHVPYDDYTEFARAIAVYGLDWAGIKAKHNIRDRTLVLATSYRIMGATVQTMKTSFHINRPDGSNLHSFPSGHTATGVMHVLNKKH